MANNLFIKRARLVNFDSTQDDVAILVENGKIKAIGKDLSVPSGCKVIDAGGKYVFPGGIDPHTHLEEEIGNICTIDDFYHGTIAAVAGGTTTIIDFVIPQKGQSLLAAYDKWRAKAALKAVCDYGFHCAITWWSPKVHEEMEILTREKGISSFKCFMAFKELFQLEDSELYEVFERCRDLGALAQVHAGVVRSLDRIPPEFSSQVIRITRITRILVNEF